MLRGSLNEPDGADRKGGGNGRGGRLAKRATPVSKRKGGSRGWSVEGGWEGGGERSPSDPGNEEFGVDVDDVDADAKRGPRL